VQAIYGNPSHSYTECHLPYEITQCYLYTMAPDTNEHTPPLPQPEGWYSIYRPFNDGGLSKPRPRVQRTTGPRLLRDNPGHSETRRHDLANASRAR